MAAAGNIATWFRSPRIRRGLAASAIVLSCGGLVLFRASGGNAQVLITTPVGQATSTKVPFQGPGAHGTFAISHSRIASGTHDLFGDVRVVADASGRAEAR